ncbi:MAG: TIGR00730 family Rossman fold protein [Saezia sp.]
MTDSIRHIAQETSIDACSFVDPIKELCDPPTFRLAFADSDFLMRRETRGIRVQLELLKPDLILKEHNINSTVVVFGSARLRSQEDADKHLKEIEEKLAKQPEASDLQKKLVNAQHLARDAHYYEEAREIGRIVGQYERQAQTENKVFICTGGGPGIMEAANRGASEAGSPNIGLNIVLPHEQGFNPYITPDLCFRFHYFATRKMHFLMRAKALITFPGGFGTLDELFEMLTLTQTRKTRAVPIILYGEKFWKKLVDFDALVEMGMISPEDVHLFRYANTPEEAWEIIRECYAL